MLKESATYAIKHRLWHPRHLRHIARDLLRGSGSTAHTHETHLRALIDWLCLAQDVRVGKYDQGGISAGWSFEAGWLPAYAETSGYIIETLCAGSSILGRRDLAVRANRIIDWLLTLQDEGGGFPGGIGEPRGPSVIFNTGQIMHGLIAGHEILGRKECVDSAVRAGRWLATCQDEDGCWRHHVYRDMPHTYNTRTAWALARTGILSDEQVLTAGARKNIEWALKQQNASGWYRQNGFVRNFPPFTHTIAYALRGILESGLLLDDDPAVRSAVRAAGALAEHQREDGSLAGAYDDGWRPAGPYCCLTGLAQTVLVWERLRQHSESKTAYTGHIERGIRYLKGRHLLSGTRAERGAMAGSFPIWGAYQRFMFPNWAAKFFADALMMDGESVIIPAVQPVSRPSGP